MECETNQYFLTLQNINPRIAEKSIIGSLVQRASQIQEEMRNGVKKPFKEIIRANIGDFHAMGQSPITFVRQVIALLTYSVLNVNPLFPKDAIDRSRLILDGCRGASIGSFTDPWGLEIVRKHVAEFIERRDGGHRSNWKNILLTSGATDGIKRVLKLFVNKFDARTGVMVPIPQYPVYSNILIEYDMYQIHYYLDESHGWSVNVGELERAIEESRLICKPRVLVVMNPGNPTGQVLTRKSMEGIIKFAYRHQLFLLADEVYQDNVYYDTAKFYSFKKVLTEMEKPYNEMELASFMSCSKGYMGECGFRCGYTEVINMCPNVKQVFFQLEPSTFCPTALGQVCLDIFVNPPREGEPSYKSFKKEKQDVINSLKLRAKLVVRNLNSIMGFKCTEVQGAVFAFPRFELPPKAIEAAREAKLHPDAFYAFQLLENTGILVIPGSDFGQQPNTFHFRTTILPPERKLRNMLKSLKLFHEQFIEKYT